MNFQDLRQRLNIFIPMCTRCRLRGHDWEVTHATPDVHSGKRVTNITRRCRRCDGGWGTGGAYELRTVEFSAELEAELWMKNFAKREGMPVADVIEHTELYLTDEGYRHECGSKIRYPAEFWLYYQRLTS